jgi:hypothetical protein
VAANVKRRCNRCFREAEGASGLGDACGRAAEEGGAACPGVIANVIEDDGKHYELITVVHKADDLLCRMTQRFRRATGKGHVAWVISTEAGDVLSVGRSGGGPREGMIGPEWLKDEIRRFREAD